MIKMPNRLTRNSDNTLVPKVGGTKPDGTIVGAKLDDLTVTAGKLADDAVQGRTVDFFKSTVTTGNGSNQQIAHGLGRLPTFVIVIPQTSSATGVSVVEGTHDSTNIVVNAPATTTFRVIAF